MTGPTARDVAQRVTILKYQVAHAMILPPDEVLEVLSQKWSKEERKNFLTSIKEHSRQAVAVMKSNQLWKRMSGEEREFIQSLPGKAKRQYHLNAMWRQESAVVLMWCLGMIKDLPPFDVQADPKFVVERTPVQDLDSFFRGASLLPEKEIWNMQSIAELWHWRSRTRQLVDMKAVPPAGSGFASFDQIVRSVAREASKEKDLFQPIDEDFPARGKAYRDLSGDEWSEIQSIAIERHRAFNWVCGLAPGNQWDKTPTDT